MSALEPPNASADPHGLPLGMVSRSDPGMDGHEDVSEQVRSRWISMTLIALALVVVIAGGGALVVGQTSLSAGQVAVVVAAASILMSLVALGRAYFFFRAIRPVSAGHGLGPDETSLGDEPPERRKTVPENTPGLPPPVSQSMSATEFDTVGADAGLGVRREVFGKLAFRLQSLVNRLIHRIDEVEQEIEDPELLKSLYAIDHLATRIRRQIENLAVLGGEAPQRRSDIPIEVNAVLRAAVAEIEHYTQVTAVPIHEVKIRGHVVAEIIHLLAELLENATTFTTPGAPKVMLRAQLVTAGLAILVQDRGIGLSADDITRINCLLNGSTHIDVGQLLQEGRIGLAVVEILARRHGIGAELQPNIFGGIDAAIVIPHELLSERDVSGTFRDALPGSTGLLHASTPAESQRHEVPAQPHASLSVQGPTASVRALSGVRGGERPYAAPPAPSSVPGPGLCQEGGSASQGAAGERLRDDPVPTRDRGKQHGDERLASGLPVRRRGKSLSKLRSGTGDEASAIDVDTDRTAERTAHNDASPVNQFERPELPQRRGSHMPEELREPPQPTRSIPGHNPTLMASVLEGRGRAEQMQSETRVHDERQHIQNPHSRDIEGDSDSWPI